MFHRFSISLLTVLATGTLMLATSLSASAGGGHGHSALSYSKDGNSYSLGAFGQIDFTSYDGSLNASNNGASGSDFYFRELHLGFTIELQDKVEIFLEYGLLGGHDHGEGNLVEGSIAYRLNDRSEVKFGLFDVPFGFDSLNDEDALVTLEYSVPSSVFGGGTAYGVQYSGYNEYFSYAVGVFSDGRDENQALDLQTAARFAYTPFTASPDGLFLHLGAAWLLRSDAERGSFVVATAAMDGGTPDDPSDDTPAVYRSNFRLEAHNEINRANELESSPLAFDESETFSLEVAGTWQSLYFQFEHYESEYQGLRDPSGVRHGADYDGLSMLVAWTLTGERRSYDHSSGLFGGIEPASASGAWEIYARYSELDLANDPTETGADPEAFTIGVNWYLNENLRLGATYVDFDDESLEDSSGEGIVLRLQFVF